MDALLLVDIQNDFVPGGTLPVTEGDCVVEVANRLMSDFELVVATKDLHPADHVSFASQHADSQPGDIVELDGIKQTLWPEHCIAGSPGADFVAGLNTSKIGHIAHKGTMRSVDSYSAFFDNAHTRSTGLGDFLKRHKVDRIFIMGLATDYCVKFTALDAMELGFRTYLIKDGCRGVDVQPGDVDRAVDEMEKAGVSVVSSNEVAAARGH